MSFQVEYFSGQVAGQVTLDIAKLQDKKHVSQQVSLLLPKGMVLDYALIKKQENLIMAVPKRLPLQMEFPEKQLEPTLSSCGKFVASGGVDNKVKVWNLETQECMTLEGHTNWVDCVAFSSCGKFVASGALDKKVKVWNLETQECMTLEEHTGSVYCVAFSPCGRMLQSASRAEVKAWHLGTHVEIEK